jgi:cytochrome c oxidase assembly protein subunit 11
VNDARAPVDANRRTALKLAGAVVAMFGFGYALVPLYDVFCEITGLNGKTGVVSAASLDGNVDTTRSVTVEFMTSVNSGLPWEFRPSTARTVVHPGGVYEATFYARNISGETIVGHAVPSVAPGTASRHFNKIECFCFTEQRFGPGEGREMPVRFVIDRGLPAEIRTVTLSYTFFRSKERT